MVKKPYKYGKYADFRQWLIDAGYSPHTVTKYLKGISMYDGEELTDEAIKAWREKLVADGMWNRSAGEYAQGVRRYRNFVNGERIINKYNKFHCDDDCFNCKYDDCYKPDYMCKSEVNDGNCD